MGPQRSIRNNLNPLSSVYSTMFDFTENHNISHGGIVKSELTVHRTQKSDYNVRRSIKDTINRCINFVHRASAVCSGHEEVEIYLRVPVYFKGRIVTVESDFQSIQDTMDFVNSMELPQCQKPAHSWITTATTLDLSGGDVTTEDWFRGVFPD